MTADEYNQVQLEVYKNIVRDLIKVPSIDKKYISSNNININLDLPGIQKYLHPISDKLGFPMKKVKNILKLIYKLQPVACYDIIEMEIAKRLDLKYSDHIKYSEEYWAIDSCSGKVFEREKVLKNFNNVPLYRTKEDALRSFNILKPVFPNIYGK